MTLPANIEPLTNWRKYFLPDHSARVEERGTHRQLINKLSPKHRKVISLHLKGISNYEIALLVGYSTMYVSIIINQDITQSLIARHAQSISAEISALNGSAVDAFRRGLDSADEKVSLIAADKVFKANGVYNSHHVKKEDESAEDFIERLMEKLKDTDLNRSLPNKMDPSKMIDITPNKEVDDGSEQINIQGQQGPDIDTG